MSPFFPQATSFFILSLWKDNEIVNSPYVYGLCSAVAQRLGRGTQRKYSSKPLKHSIVKRILEFKR